MLNMLRVPTHTVKSLLLIFLVGSLTVFSTEPENTIVWQEIEIEGEAMGCDYRGTLMATPGFMDCLNAAFVPGYKWKLNVNPGAALCGPFGSWQGYIWLTFDCPPPCLGPPDILVAEVLFCGNCTLLGWTCY